MHRPSVRPSDRPLESTKKIFNASGARIAAYRIVAIDDLGDIESDISDTYCPGRLILSGSECSERTLGLRCSAFPAQTFSPQPWRLPRDIDRSQADRDKTKRERERERGGEGEEKERQDQKQRKGELDVIPPSRELNQMYANDSRLLPSDTLPQIILASYAQIDDENCVSSIREDSLWSYRFNRRRPMTCPGQQSR